MPFSLDDLMVSQHGSGAQPTDDEALEMLGSMHEEWVESGECVLGDLSTLPSWAFERFSIDEQSTTFIEIDQCVKRKMYQLLRLDEVLRDKGLMDDDAHVRDRVIRICKIMVYARDMIYRQAAVVHALDDSRFHSIPEKVDIETILDDRVNDKLTSLQHVIRFILSRLKLAEYRRIDDECWRQVHTSDGFPTYAWEKVKTIKEFIHATIKKESDYAMWKHLSSTHDNDDKTVKWLMSQDEDEFPTLVPNRYLFAFNNGVYNIREDMFWPFGDEAEYADMAREMTQFRRANGWGETYEATPICARTDVAISFFDQPFRYVISPETERTFDPWAIVLPEFEIITTAQGLDAETSNWLLLMMIRLLYEVNELDAWQVILFVKGVAGCGKSTLAKFMRLFYPFRFYSTLTSNIEEKFGLSGIYQGLMCICSEVRDDFKLDQGDWQSAATGEEVQIAVKNKTAFSWKWITSMFMLGNQVMNYKDNSGSVERRTFLIDFMQKVRKKDSDPHLFEKMKGNLDAALRKGNVLYHDQVRRNGDKDIWTPGILPKQIHDMHAALQMTVDPLLAFITQSDQFKLDISLKMPLTVFREMYFEYRRNNGLPTARLTRDVYHGTFQDCNIGFTTGQLDYRGEKVKGGILCGIDVQDE